MADIRDYMALDPRPNSVQHNEDGSLFRANLLQLDSNAVEGAPYFTITWYHSAGDPHTDEHVHEFDEFLGFCGSDANDPTNLNGRVRFRIDGEDYVFDKSSVLFIPAGTPHCPYVIEELTKPIIHWSAFVGGKEYKKKLDDGKEVGYEDEEYQQESE